MGLELLGGVSFALIFIVYFYQKGCFLFTCIISNLIEKENEVKKKCRN